MVEAAETYAPERSPCCIFCGHDFSPPNIRTEEHVVPKSLMGTLVIYDVCKGCNDRFGAKGGPDHLAFQDLRIIEAIRVLNLPELHKRIRDEAQWTSKDAKNKLKIPRTSSKDGKVKIAPHEYEPGKMLSSDTDFAKIYGSQLQKKLPEGLESHAIPGHVAKIKEILSKLDVGQEHFDPVTGHVIQKHAIESECSFKETPRAANRLIAKIGCELSHIFIPAERLALLERKLVPLRSFALEGKPMNDDCIFLPPGSTAESFDASKADYFHQITFGYEDWAYVIHVLLFGVVDFQIVWTPGQGPILDEYGEQVKAMVLHLSFEPGKSREKLIGKLVASKEEFEWVSLEAAL